MMTKQTTRRPLVKMSKDSKDGSICEREQLVQKRSSNQPMRIDAVNKMDEMYLAQGAAQKDQQTCRKSKRRRVKSPSSS